MSAALQFGGAGEGLTGVGDASCELAAGASAVGAAGAGAGTEPGAGALG